MNLDQPPVGSVVLDVDGDAWQRHSDPIHGDHWALASAHAFRGEATWERLAERYGPLRLIYTPGADR